MVKKITENPRTVTIAKEFVYGGRHCVISFVDNANLRKLANDTNYADRYLSDYHNGYIEIKESEHKEEFDYHLCEEVTFLGDLSFLGKDPDRIYIGFDTMHYYNHENPETKTLEHVKIQCIKIVDELNEQLTS